MILLIDTTKEKLGKTSLGRLEDTVKRFAGPEYFSFPMRVTLQIMFKTVAKKRYAAVANEWGCKKPIDYKPWK